MVGVKPATLLRPPGRYGTTSTFLPDEKLKRCKLKRVTANCLSALYGVRMQHWIIENDLPPDKGDDPAITLSEAGTRGFRPQEDESLN